MKLTLALTFLLLALHDATAQSYGRCFTPSQDTGSCVYIDQCPELNALIKKPKNQVTHEERLYLSLSQCGYFDRKPLVCCKQGAAATPPPPPPPPPPQGNDLLPKPGQCGNDAEDRIYGGNATQIDEFPWMALLEYSKPNNRKGFHCGGVLINSRYVLTASHCVNGKDLPSTWTLSSVRLGEWDTSKESDCDNSFDDGPPFCSDAPIDVPIEKLIPHENYNPQAANQHNDIALLRLSRVVPTTRFIRPICMPVDQGLRSDLLVSKTMSVAGWGKTEKVSASPLKLKVNIDGVANDKCQQTYSQENREIIGSQICAGGLKGFDSCRGDSGGPLMRQNSRGNPPYWYLAGLVSYGPSPCGQEGWPGVYTRVAHYVDWVSNTIKP